MVVTDRVGLGDDPDAGAVPQLIGGPQSSGREDGAVPGYLASQEPGDLESAAWGWPGKLQIGILA